MRPQPPSPQVILLLSSLIEERLGLHYGPHDEPIFVDKVLGRMHEAGFETPLDYYYFLRYDLSAAAELEALADTLVVGETYFFREVDALRAGVEHVVRPAVAARGRARVWSAGCATGEEPVTLAMLLADAGLLESTDIVATDVSARALGRARAGVYGSRALRLLPRELGGTAPDGDHAAAALAATARPWLSADGALVRASRRLVDAIDYRRVNLVDARAVTTLGEQDLIVCRNVLIYFRDETVRSVVASLAGALRAGGRLIVGASESLLRFGTVLHCEERDGAFLYAKGVER